jgi:hypothetical protein
VFPAPGGSRITEPDSPILAERIRDRSARARRLYDSFTETRTEQDNVSLAGLAQGESTPAGRLAPARPSPSALTAAL